MIKKILVTVLITFISTIVVAKPNITTIKLDSSNQDQNIYSWAISSPAMGAGIASGTRNRTVIVYVNKHLALNPYLPSDPVRINCNGVPTIINPGSSALCEIPANYATSWELEPGFYRYGSEGAVAAVE